MARQTTITAGVIGGMVLLALVQAPDNPVQSQWEFRHWSTYTWPAYALLAGIAISLLAILRITIRYRRARRWRVAQWNRPLRDARASRARRGWSDGQAP